MDQQTFYKINYGVYIVSAKLADRLNGQIANTVFQITAKPAIVGISINKDNLTHEFIQKSSLFSVSILVKETPLKFIGDFGFKTGRNFNKFAGINYKLGISGAPVVLENSLGYLECSVINSLAVFTHTVFIGEVVHAELINDQEPLSYAYYRLVKGGTTSKNAPTYVEPKEQPRKKELTAMDKFVCKVCGYIYDPAKGDPDSSVRPGTPFAQLPDDWVCPVCGAGKDQFEKAT